MTIQSRRGRSGRTRRLGNASASHSYSSSESSGTSSSSDHHSYSGSDDDSWTVTDYGSYTEEGDTGFYSSTENWSGSYTYDGSGTNNFSATFTGAYPSSSDGTGTYTDHDTFGYSGGELSVESYDPEGTVARQWGYDDVENSTNDQQSGSSATTTDPMRTYTSSMSGHNVTTAEEEWHTSGASGPDGSTSAGSDAHRESVSHYTTFNWSDGGTSSSGTMDVSFVTVNESPVLRAVVG